MRQLLRCGTVGMVSSIVFAGWLHTTATAWADEVKNRSLYLTDFSQAAPRGFGDRNNSWAQAMAWWHDGLYVGTSRQSVCSSLFSIWSFASIAVSRDFADTFLPYPPRDPDLSCAADGADLSLQAEIWRWTPNDGLWQRVFQSPLELDNPGPGAPIPPPLGKKLPYDISIRGMTAHKEPDGTDALYAFGVNSTASWDRSRLPPPRVLRSTDGANFVPVPQTPGTFLGSMPFNADHSSFRSPVSYAGKLYVLAGAIFGQGALIGSADPAKGDNAWFLASPPGLQFYETAAFNGWLYLGGFDPQGGYAIYKTLAAGTPPYQLTTVVPRGGFLPKTPAKSVVIMREFDGRLYVGTGSQTEVIRIYPDDTWDLVVGPPRAVPTADGKTEWKYPLSGLDAGFGHSLNDHAWNMATIYGQQYLGTYNAAIGAKNDPVYAPLLRHNMGAHLYRSPDGWYYSAITTNGFENPRDPLGGHFDYGIRTIVQTPYGPFFGTANDYYGLAILHTGAPSKPAVLPPQKLEVETLKDGFPLLSWNPSERCKKYEIWRAEIIPIAIRDDTNIEAFNGTTGNKIADTYVGPYQPIGVSAETTFIDYTVSAGKRYMYYVLAYDNRGQVSEGSSLGTFPVLTPAMSFAELLRWVDRVKQRDYGRKAAPPWTGDLRRKIDKALVAAQQCRLRAAQEILQDRAESERFAAPGPLDLNVLFGKLSRRLELYSRYHKDMVTDEFCKS